MQIYRIKLVAYMISEIDIKCAASSVLTVFSEFLYKNIYRSNMILCPTSGYFTVQVKHTHTQKKRYKHAKILSNI